MTGGVFIYVGKTQSGKTTKALSDMKADIALDGRPSLILDLGPAKNFVDFPHEPNVEAVLTKLYGECTHAVFTPKDEDDFNALMRGVSAAGGIHVLMDEVRWVASSHKISHDLTKALRHWAHGSTRLPVCYRCTSQRPGDLHRDFYACLTGELYAFRTDPGPDLDRLVNDYHFSADELPLLARGECRTYQGGW